MYNTRIETEHRSGGKNSTDGKPVTERDPTTFDLLFCIETVLPNFELRGSVETLPFLLSIGRRDKISELQPDYWCVQYGSCCLSDGRPTDRRYIRSASLNGSISPRASDDAGLNIDNDRLLQKKLSRKKSSNGDSKRAYLTWPSSDRMMPSSPQDERTIDH